MHKVRVPFNEIELYVSRFFHRFKLDVIIYRLQNYKHPNNFGYFNVILNCIFTNNYGLPSVINDMTCKNAFLSKIYVICFKLNNANFYLWVVFVMPVTMMKVYS